MVEDIRNLPIIDSQRSNSIEFASILNNSVTAIAAFKNKKVEVILTAPS